MLLLGLDSEASKYALSRRFAEPARFPGCRAARRTAGSLDGVAYAATDRRGDTHGHLHVGTAPAGRCRSGQGQDKLASLGRRREPNAALLRRSPRHRGPARPDFCTLGKLHTLFRAKRELTALPEQALRLPADNSRTQTVGSLLPGRSRLARTLPANRPRRRSTLSRSGTASLREASTSTWTLRYEVSNASVLL